MKRSHLLKLLPAILICVSTSLAGDRNPEAGERQGEPNRHQYRYGTLETYTEPNPIILKAREPIQYFYIRADGFRPDDVVLESVKVMGKIPAYAGIEVKGDWIITTAFVFRFLGSGGFRPITGDFTAPYTVELDLINGDHVVAEGEFSLIIYPGDLTFDGRVDLEDLILLSEFLFSNGEPCLFEELMDLDHDGDVDEDDLEILVALAGL